MTMDTSRGGANSPEPIDADAVCGACGTVNPEGTLICKQCGNNLRDQRARRMQTADAELVERKTAPSRQVALAIISVVGLILLALTALNVDRIAEGLISPGGGAGDGAELYFSGADSVPFRGLADRLETQPITQEELAAAGAAQEVIPGIGGRYVLRTVPAGGLGQVIGSAVVEASGGDNYFVADIRGTEIRGVLRADGEGRLAGRAAFESDDGYVWGYGDAQSTPPGLWTLYATSEIGDDLYSAVASRVSP